VVWLLFHGKDDGSVWLGEGSECAKGEMCSCPCTAISYQLKKIAKAEMLTREDRSYLILSFGFNGKVNVSSRRLSWHILMRKKGCWCACVLEVIDGQSQEKPMGSYVGWYQARFTSLLKTRNRGVSFAMDLPPPTTNYESL
jgi:hypothetical protein